MFEDNIYAGEAMLDTLSQEEKRMVPYAVDLSVEAQVLQHEVEHVSLETLKDGLWTQSKAKYKIARYRFHNKSDKTKELVVEHEVSPGKLVNTPEPIEATRNYWRFALSLPAKTSLDFPVTVRLDEQFRLSLMADDPDWIRGVLQSSRCTTQISGFLDGLRDLGQTLSELQILEQGLRQRVETLVHDQGRLRENLSKLSQSHDEARLRSRYVAELERQEDELTRLNEELLSVETKRRESLRALRELVGTLSFEEAFEKSPLEG